MWKNMESIPEEWKSLTTALCRNIPWIYGYATQATKITTTETGGMLFILYVQASLFFPQASIQMSTSLWSENYKHAHTFGPTLSKGNLWLGDHF